MEGLKLIKCEKCGVLHPVCACHTCDAKVLHGYQTGIEATYNRIRTALGDMQDIYTEAIIGSPAASEEFSKGVVSALFIVKKLIDDLESNEAYRKVEEK